MKYPIHTSMKPSRKNNKNLKMLYLTLILIKTLTGTVSQSGMQLLDDCTALSASHFSIFSAYYDSDTELYSIPFFIGILPTNSLKAEVINSKLTLKPGPKNPTYLVGAITNANQDHISKIETQLKEIKRNKKNQLIKKANENIEELFKTLLDEEFGFSMQMDAVDQKFEELDKNASVWEWKFDIVWDIQFKSSTIRFSLNFHFGKVDDSSSLDMQCTSSRGNATHNKESRESLLEFGLRDGDIKFIKLFKTKFEEWKEKG